ncbi:circadian clock protein KaiB [Caenimonas sedimenti]|uniref:Circadian clock protein KaiB n=1 Tax=Caenimonas sedimenti TaxID=2596921 RepID=A0A562ZVX2_9BURK|nr:circadian clock KaiB family protein [Caenimonas sedimenti]TWO72762.1 circadian clock protein KaiB [Caenimonas sedimenti]
MNDDCILRLYLSSAAPLSSKAVVNTRAFCEQHLAGRYQLEILSIADNVDKAMQDQVLAAPTLVRVSPLPVRKFIGDMSNADRLLDGLGLRGRSAA